MKCSPVRSHSFSTVPLPSLHILETVPSISACCSLFFLGVHVSGYFCTRSRIGNNNRKCPPPLFGYLFKYLQVVMSSLTGRGREGFPASIRGGLWVSQICSFWAKFVSICGGLEFLESTVALEKTKHLGVVTVVQVDWYLISPCQSPHTSLFIMIYFSERRSAASLWDRREGPPAQGAPLSCGCRRVQGRPISEYVPESRRCPVLQVPPWICRRPHPDNHVL